MAWAEIDLAAIAHNTQEVKRWIGAKTELAAVVKANAYGHGLVPVSRAVLRAGADRLAVVSVSEAMTLRRGGIQGRILLMGFSLAEDAPAIVHYGLTPTVNSQALAAALSDAALAQGRVAPVHLKVDTGMGRFGLLTEEVVPFAKELVRRPGLRLEGFWTHFATAEEADKSFTRQQLAVYQQVLADLHGAGIHVPVRHAANSGATLDLPETHLDLVRCGILLYGLYPSPELNRPVDLRPVLTLKARVGRVRTLPGGASVSYGRTYVTPGPTPVALVPIGYGDGYHRCLSNRGMVLVQGQRASILGRVCMDQFVVDVSGISAVHEGDEVVIIGAQGDDRISAEEVAVWGQTANYEVITSLTSRVPRVYLGADQAG
ncbi:MAG: alanine racemase [Chloroflexi bacterium]|nr:alanine racemase [Chloroflexota bacterium]